MPSGANHPFTREQRAVIGREGGLVSGKVRQDRVLQRYMDIVRTQGVYAALVACRRDAWRSGFDARRKKRKSDV